MKIIVIFTIITVSSAVKLPANFQKCNRKQEDFKECVLRAAQDGVSQLVRPYPEVNLPSLNPFEIAETNIGGGDGPVAVNQKFRNCKLFGFDKIQMDRYEFNFEEKKLDVEGVFPEIRKMCDYEMKGKVLILVVNGKGNSTIVLKKLKVSCRLDYEEFKKRNKTYIKFVTNKLTMDPELVTFDFENHLDKSITENINPVLNENWKEIFDDVKNDYIEIINRVLLNLLNNFFAKVSLEEAFD